MMSACQGAEEILIVIEEFLNEFMSLAQPSTPHAAWRKKIRPEGGCTWSPRGLAVPPILLCGASAEKATCARSVASPEQRLETRADRACDVVEDLFPGAFWKYHHYGSGGRSRRMSSKSVVWRLDFTRAQAWLCRHRGRIRLDSDPSPYNFLITWFANLAWPTSDEAWKDSDVAAVVFYSYERDHDNFLFRRAAGGLPLLSLSQTTLDSRDGDVFTAVIKGEIADESPRARWLRGYARFANSPRVHRVRLVPVWSTRQKSIWGVLMIFERKRASYDYAQIGLHLGAFLDRYMPHGKEGVRRRGQRRRRGRADAP